MAPLWYQSADRSAHSREVRNWPPVVDCRPLSSLVLLCLFVAKENMSSKLGPRFNDAVLSLVTFEHRFDPYFRDAFNALFQRPIVEVTQLLLRLLHRNPETRLCEEIPMPDESAITAGIKDAMAQYTEREYQGRIAERAGNTKTYGVVRGDFRVLENIPPAYKHGVFAEAKTYPAWIRFGGPGPASPPDIADSGILSIGMKLMGVPGEKLLADEKATQDFTGISCPTFTTPNIVENLKLQQQIYKRTPVFYFIEQHMLTVDSATGGKLRDREMEEIYRSIRRRPDGRSLGPVHDFLWQVAVTVLALRPLSQAEHEEIFGRLARSCSNFAFGATSRNYFTQVGANLARL